MLDDGDGGGPCRIELGDEFVGGVGVVDVVVGELLALDLAGGGDAGTGLAGRDRARPPDAGSRRSVASAPSRPAKLRQARERARRVAPANQPDDRRVIGGGAGEGLGREALARSA